MAGVVVFALAMAAIKAKDAVQDRRSPLLPLPSTSATLTERDLKKALIAWATREQVLSAKYRGLEHCAKQGYSVCWAGRVSDKRDVKKARDEARWVTNRLGEALNWCRAQGVRKGSLLVVGRKAAEKRPRHATTPPSLFELPFPLPAAPKNNIYDLTVPQNTAEAPPMYAEEVTEGEKLLECAAEPEYEP